MNGRLCDGVVVMTSVKSLLVACLRLRGGRELEAQPTFEKLGAVLPKK